MGRRFVIAALLLAGCGGLPSTDAPTVLRCPVIAPDAQCPQWPIWNTPQDLDMLPQDLDILQEFYLRGEASHAACTRAVQAWEDAWRSCGTKE